MKTTRTYTTRSAALAATAGALAVSLVALHLAMMRPVAPPARPSTADHLAITGSAGSDPLDVVWRGRRQP